MNDITVPSDRFRSIILALCLEAEIANEGAALVKVRVLGMQIEGAMTHAVHSTVRGHNIAELKLTSQTQSYPITHEMHMVNSLGLCVKRDSRRAQSWESRADARLLL